MGSRVGVGPVFALFLGRSPSPTSSISDSFLLDSDDGRVENALDAPFSWSNPLDK